MKPARNIPKEISSFGERQFNDTGAELVEVLRVKASTIRKHFKELGGISYLVSVVQRDRVRVYFFTSAGTMLLGENLDHAKYEKIRNTSKLITKFAKPRPPTQEELRMEATEELRQLISRFLRRTSRVLGKTEPEFPNIFVRKGSLGENGQGFGLLHDENGDLVFGQDALDSTWSDGIIARASFLQFIDNELRDIELVNAVANCFAYAILANEVQTSWLSAWMKATRETPMVPIICHLEKHAETYKWNGFIRLLDLLQSAPLEPEVGIAKSVLAAIHNSHEVPLGHDEHMALLSFCRSLEKPRHLIKNYRVLESIHLGPRVLFDPSPLGISLHLSDGESSKTFDDWLEVSCQAGAKRKNLQIVETGDNPLRSIHYRLRVEDIFPKLGGLISHGKDVIDWVLRSIGIEAKSKETFSATIIISDRTIGAAEIAVLERLAKGDERILEDTLVGSLHRVETLLTQECIVLVPSFNHIGVEIGFLVEGDTTTLQDLSNYALESTIFSFANSSFMVCSAPSTWRKFMLKAAHESGCSVWPVIEAKSKRRLIRSERLFSKCLPENYAIH